MNLTTEHANGIAVVRVGESRLMDLYRQASAAGGALKLAGVQKRVETMLTMTGAQNFIEVHPDEPSAVKSFGA